MMPFLRAVRGDELLFILMNGSGTGMDPKALMQ
jgi:hypothetical protein